MLLLLWRCILLTRVWDVARLWRRADCLLIRLKSLLTCHRMLTLLLHVCALKRWVHRWPRTCPSEKSKKYQTSCDHKKLLYFRFVVLLVWVLLRWLLPISEKRIGSLFMLLVKPVLHLFLVKDWLLECLTFRLLLLLPLFESFLLFCCLLGKLFTHFPGFICRVFCKFCSLTSYFLMV